jgi:hypothetical protein
LEDTEHLSPHGPATPRFGNCNNQGISAGWADLYGSGLDCQWIDITGLPDDEYTVEARTIRSGIVREDSYGDNFTWAGVRITGNAVTEIPVPCYPEDCLGFNNANVQAQNVGGSWKVVDGDHWMLDFGVGEANARKAVWLIKKYGFSFICFVGSRPDPPMMYFRK